MQLYSSMTAALEGGEWSAARPGRTLPPRKTRYPFYRRLGGPQGPVWTGGKSRPHRDSIPDRLPRSSVAIPTELPGPLIWNKYISKLPEIQDKKNCEAIQTDKTALNMSLVIRLLLRLSEFDSLRPYQTTGVSIFRLEPGAEL